jgi:hypothetical protein
MGRPSNRAHSTLKYLAHEARLYLRDDLSRLKIRNPERLRDQCAPLLTLADELREKLSGAATPPLP